MEKIKSIFRPGGEEDDNVMYGTPEPKNTHAQGGSHDHEDVGPAMLQTDPSSEVDKKHEGEANEPSTGISSQSLRDAKYDEQRYGGETGNAAVPGTTLSRMKESGMSDSCLSLKSGKRGPYAGQADGSMTGRGSGTIGGHEGLPDRTRGEGTTGSGSGVRDAALGGAAANEPMQAYSGSGTERSFPLSGGATSGSTSDPSQRYGTDEAMRQDPSSASQSHLGRDTALGAGAGALGAGALAHEHGQHQQQSTSGMDIPGDSAGYHHPDEKPYEGYVHQTKGPHATDMANILDPHVPGEYPSEDGQERHTSHLGRDAGIGGAGLGTGQGYSGDGTSDALPSTSQHDYGRDAGLAGGAGAAGLGAYELSKDHGDKLPTTNVDPSTSSSGYTGGQGYPGGRDSEGVPASYAVAESEQPKHHYGRDAGLAGGAGAAGVGAYEYEKNKGRGDTGPASKTIGPHESNVANIVDPRVKPDKSKMQDHAPTQGWGGGDSEGVPGQSAVPAEKQHHYGRDAALGGGAGAAGVGAYEYEKNKNQRDQLPINPNDPLTSSSGHNTSGLGYPNEKSSNIGYDDPSTTQQPQHHYGRDAAVAGGAGAVGVGAYEATKSHGEENAAPMAQEQAAAGHHEHNKLHKKNDPRGQQYPQYAEDKHEKHLQKARDEEAAKGGDHGHEKKEGFLHKLLHHGDKDKHAGEGAAAGGAAAAAGGAGAFEHEKGNAGTSDGRVIEPHTGLPMNVEKYGTYGHGGTDGGQQIEGYHETDPAVRQAEHGTGEISHGHHAGEEGVTGPDWDKIKKSNTPY